MNLGILGSGFIVDIFMENVHKVPEIKLKGLWARNIEKANKFKDKFDYVTDDLERLLNDDEIDVVYLALSNSVHFEYAKIVLKHNKHLMLEKPFVQTYDEALELFNMAKERHLLLFETIMTKYAPGYIEAKKYLKEIGDIKYLDINFSQYSRRYDKFKEGIILPAFSRELCGGALMDLGVYNIHFVVGMFDEPKDIKYFPNMMKDIDTSGLLVLDYGDFKASLFQAKDCKTNPHCIIQGDKACIYFESTTSRCSRFKVIYNDGRVISYGDNDDEEFVGWKTMYQEFVRLFMNMDLDTCYKHMEETLAVQKILETAGNQR